MKRKASKKCVHISGILADLLKQHRRKSGKELTRILEIWDGIVGSSIAENAQPVGYKNGQLVVNVTSSVWIQQLQFLKSDLLARVNNALEKPLVTDVKFRIGPLIM